MAYSLTDALQHERFTVVEVDRAAGRLRIRASTEVCSDLACGDAIVQTDEGQTRDLGAINAGDIVAIEERDGQARQIRVVRRVYDEYGSPEF